MTTICVSSADEGTCEWLRSGSLTGQADQRWGIGLVFNHPSWHSWHPSQARTPSFQPAWLKCQQPSLTWVSMMQVSWMIMESDESIHPNHREMCYTHVTVIHHETSAVVGIPDGSE